MKQTLIIIGIIIGLYAQAQDNNKNNFIAIEIDPAPFILNGYSFSLKFSPKKLTKLSIMGSVFSSEFPDGMMNDKNKKKGWTDMHFETSYAVFLDYYLKDQLRGFYFGPSMLFYNKSASLEGVQERIEFSSIYPNFRLGYIWYPFKRINLYVNPWASIGSEIEIDNGGLDDEQAFSPNSFHYIVALHIGYSFGF